MRFSLFDLFVYFNPDDYNCCKLITGMLRNEFVRLLTLKTILKIKTYLLRTTQLVFLFNYLVGLPVQRPTLLESTLVFSR